jgi:hypothetical protein
MKNISFDTIAPYLVEPVRMNTVRFNEIKTFIREVLGSKFLRASPENSTSSSSKFSLTFNKDWQEVENTSAIDNQHNYHFYLAVHISERGPFVISEGIELQSRSEEDWVPPGTDVETYRKQMVFRSSNAAEEKAKEIAMKVAERFNLIYLDRDWLSQFKVAEEDLPQDALIRIDFDEPNALNLLFAETL